MNSYFAKDTITIFHVSSTRGVGGEIVKSYTSSFDMLGSFQDASGSWNQAKDIEAFRKTKTFYGDYTTAVLDTDRIKYNGKMYEVIEVITPFGKHTEIQMQIRSTS